MSTPRPVVVIGIYGSQLDAGGKNRWERWRPTLSLFQHDDLLISRLELLVEPQFQAKTDVLVADIRQVSPESAVRVHGVSMPRPWDFESTYEALREFALRYPWRPEEEDYLIHITTGTHVAQICLFLLTESRHWPGRLLQSAPPSGGEPSRYTIIDLDLSRYDAIARRFAREKQEGLSFLKDGIETRNEAFNRMMERIEKVAGISRAPMLLTGPTGAGKTRLARRIYELKRQRRQITGAFVELNCATVRGDAAASMLFGHTRGAYTGAAGERAGLLKTADKGLLFLDEIGELGLDEQAMLLRALEEKRFLPMGSDRSVESDFLLLAGTNRDLRASVREGRFRADLLERLAVWTFRLPGLAERREDIPPNVEHELAQAGAALGRRITMNKEAREEFLSFAQGVDAKWSGNFRELNAAVLRMATLADGGRVTVAEVEEEAARLREGWAEPGEGDGLEAILSPEALAELDRFDRVQLAEVVRVCRSVESLSEAGRVLFAFSRAKKANPNDTDRVRKYLLRFGVEGDKLLRHR